MRAFLSILGLYNYDRTVFDDFQVPEGVDKDVAMNKILFDCAELSLIYTDPKYFKLLMKNWTDFNLPNWIKAYEALSAEYNPIHNYDKHEEWTDKNKQTTQDNVASGSNTETDVAGFNENSSLVNADRVTTGNYSEGSGKKDDDGEHKGHIYGNIGVTTSQQMVEAEMDIRMKYNIYQMISDSFKSTFCVMVY